jgi:hypothetical protein
MDSDPTLFEISAPKTDHLEPPPSSHSKGASGGVAREAGLVDGPEQTAQSP